MVEVVDSGSVVVVVPVVVVPVVVVPVVVLVVVSPVVGTLVVSSDVLVVVEVVVDICGKLPQSYESQGHPFGQFSMHGQLLTSLTSGSTIHF